jgi:bifunctional ADP-heptose synthase (sugar kinase/adenylyltransferase)
MKFLVIGDSCTDEFVYVDVNRLSSEVPIPIFTHNKTIRSGGLAKNVLRNVKSFDVDCDIVCDENKLVKTRYVDDKTNHMLFRLDSAYGVEKKFEIEQIDFSKYNAVLVSLDGRDKGRFIEQKDIEDICARHDNVFLDSKSKILEPIPEKLRYLKINEKELEINNFLKPYVYDSGQNHLKEKVIVTLGGRGCLFNGESYPCPNAYVSRDLSGAGDTFLSALAVSLIAHEKPINESIAFANKCAGVVVTKRGVTTI